MAEVVPVCNDVSVAADEIKQLALCETAKKDECVYKPEVEQVTHNMPASFQPEANYSYSNYQADGFWQNPESMGPCVSFWTSNAAYSCYCSVCNRSFPNDRSVLQHLRDSSYHNGTQEQYEAAHLLYFQDLAQCSGQAPPSMMYTSYGGATCYPAACCSSQDVSYDGSFPAMAPPPADAYTASESSEETFAPYPFPPYLPCPPPPPPPPTTPSAAAGKQRAASEETGTSGPSRAGSAAAAKAAGRPRRSGAPGGGKGTQQHGSSGNSRPAQLRSGSGSAANGNNTRSEHAPRKKLTLQQPAKTSEDYDTAFPPLKSPGSGIEPAPPTTPAPRWIAHAATSRKLRADAPTWQPADLVVPPIATAARQVQAGDSSPVNSSSSSCADGSGDGSPNAQEPSTQATTFTPPSTPVVVGTSGMPLLAGVDGLVAVNQEVAAQA